MCTARIVTLLNFKRSGYPNKEQPKCITFLIQYITGGYFLRPVSAYGQVCLICDVFNIIIKLSIQFLTGYKNIKRNLTNSNVCVACTMVLVEKWVADKDINALCWKCRWYSSIAGIQAGLYFSFQSDILSYFIRNSYIFPHFAQSALAYGGTVNFSQLFSKYSHIILRSSLSTKSASKCKLCSQRSAHSSTSAKLGIPGFIKLYKYS